MDVEDNQPIYKGKKLKNGDRAHVGAYKNNFQRIGDVYKSRNGKSPAETTRGDGLLFDKILAFKKDCCEAIVSQVGKTDFIKVGYYHQYPCVMVHINKNSIHAFPSNTPTDAAFEAWVNFLISFFIGMVNVEAHHQSIPIELVRRSSFGFLSPTIAPTGRSMRINTGLIPEEYTAILVTCLKHLDQALKAIIHEGTELPALKESSFYKSPAYKKYLEAKSSLPALTDQVQLLWQKVEKGRNGKTTVQNIVRTPYAREGVAAIVFNALKNRPSAKLAAFNAGLERAIGKLSITTSGSRKTLSFDQEGELDFSIPFSNDASYSQDENFWAILKAITEAAKRKCSEIVLPAIDHLTASITNKKLNGIYAQLELLNKLMLTYSMEASKDAQVEDGYGSDSETEERFNDINIYAKKIIVSNGMRAIWGAATAIGKKVVQACSVYLDSTYYEVLVGMKLIKELESKNITIKLAAASSTASIYMRDLNPCVTDASKPGNKDILDCLENSSAGKYFILDTTSASSEKVRFYLNRFAKSKAKALLLVSSGLKNEQLGADINSYGTVRIFTKNKNLRDSLYNFIKQNEAPVLSPTSHHYRRLMKTLGATPVTKRYFFQAEDILQDKESETEWTSEPEEKPGKKSSLAKRAPRTG